MAAEKTDIYTTFKRVRDTVLAFPRLERLRHMVVAELDGEAGVDFVFNNDLRGNRRYNRAAETIYLRIIAAEPGGSEPDHLTAVTELRKAGKSAVLTLTPTEDGGVEVCEALYEGAKRGRDPFMSRMYGGGGHSVSVTVAKSLPNARVTVLPAAASAQKVVELLVAKAKDSAELRQSIEQEEAKKTMLRKQVELDFAPLIADGVFDTGRLMFTEDDTATARGEVSAVFLLAPAALVAAGLNPGETRPRLPGICVMAALKKDGTMSYRARYLSSTARDDAHDGTFAHDVMNGPDAKAKYDKWFGECTKTASPAEIIRAFANVNNFFWALTDEKSLPRGKQRVVGTIDGDVELRETGVVRVADVPTVTPDIDEIESVLVRAGM